MVNRLEVVWTLVIVGMLAGVAAYSTLLLYNLDAVPSNPTEIVVVTGHQWYWQFYYPQNRTSYNVSYDISTNTGSGGALWAPPDSIVQINVTSVDVVHSFNIPALGVRIDAIPGRVNVFSFTVPHVPAGTQYLIQCTEFCGQYHAAMRAYLAVT